MTADSLRGLAIAEGRVKPEWIDYNDHMNVAYYVLAFDLAIDALWARLGITDEYIRETRGSTFAVETHVTYQREIREGEAYFVTMELIAYDEKRIHQFQRMYHEEGRYLVATAEWMSLHVDLSTRKVTAWPESVLAELASIASEQGASQMPGEICGRMQVASPIYAIDARGDSP